MNFKISIYYLLCAIALLICSLTLTSFVGSCRSTKSGWLSEMNAVKSSTVLLNNQNSVIPLAELQDKKIASVNLGSADALVFDSIANKYAVVDRFSAEAYREDQTLNGLNSDLKLYNTIIAQVTNQSINDIHALSFLKDIEEAGKELIVVYAGNPQFLTKLDSLHSPIIWTAAGSPYSASFTAQLIFGGTASSAKLAANFSPRFRAGDGYATPIIRLSYTVPEELGIKREDLEVPIDDIIQSAISQHVTPGAVVMVVKNGKVIFDKAYGAHTYDKIRQTRVDDIFDLASVTKIAATTMAAMRLYEEDKLNLDSTMGFYMPIARETNKRNLKVRDLMLHQAGLVPYIPFHNLIKPSEFSRDSSSNFPVKVADNYFIGRNFYDNVMLPRMLNTGLRPGGKYEYSDLSMYFMKEIIERQTSEPLDQYVKEQFYTPLGMKFAGFNPRNRFEKSNIVPTENDTYFRHTLIDGYVHDQGAALAGGVAGHAGLFSSANDLAVLFQMMLNGGSYGGKTYFKLSTVQLFTARQSDVSRRGLGFDRWDPDPINRYPSVLSSPQTYGHTGFTGTCVWVDPGSQLIYIFLSNRVYDQSANKLSSLRVRPRIQDVIYKAINNATL